MVVDKRYKKRINVSIVACAYILWFLFAYIFFPLFISSTVKILLPLLSFIDKNKISYNLELNVISVFLEMMLLQVSLSLGGSGFSIIQTVRVNDIGGKTLGGIYLLTRKLRRKIKRTQ